MQFREADGTVVSLIDKVPVFYADNRLTLGGTLPPGVAIPCEVLERTTDQAGGQSALVRLGYNLEDQRGRTTFHVDEHTLVSRTWTE